MKTYILSGPPGSGKSYLAKHIEADAIIISADHYFYGLQSSGYTGVAVSALDNFIKAKKYTFVPEEIHKAHAQCREAFRFLLKRSSYPALIIDNTHITAAEKAVYYDHASDFGDVEIIHFQTPLHVCVERNVHKVPSDIIAKMHYTHNARNDIGSLRETMPWWNVTYRD